MNQDNSFIGELKDPFSSPKITRGLVEFAVHPLQGGTLHNTLAQLISASGQIYPVAVRGTGFVHPGTSEQSKWSPGDFLVRVDGITMEQAREMHRIVQDHVEEGTPFASEVIEVGPSTLKEGWIEMRIRPQPYASLALQEAQVTMESGETNPVMLRQAIHAPASPTLGQYGDLIISLEGITLDQARHARKLVQKQTIPSPKN